MDHCDPNPDGCENIDVTYNYTTVGNLTQACGITD